MSGHIWKGLKGLARRFRRAKPEAVRPKSFDLRTDCKNPCACRIPIKCFDKEAYQYGLKS